MKSSLETLSKIQKFNINEQRKILVLHMSEESEIQNSISTLETEFEEEKNYSKINNNNKDFALYLKRYMQKKEKLEKALKEVQKKIEEIKDIITGLFKEQKTYDIVEKHRADKEIEKENLIEQKILDEIGANNYRRNNSQS